MTAEIKCPVCSTVWEVRPESVGTSIDCPNCGTMLDIGQQLAARPRLLRDTQATVTLRKPPATPTTATGSPQKVTIIGFDMSFGHVFRIVTQVMLAALVWVVIGALVFLIIFFLIRAVSVGL
ncbi:MAG: TFIIB-type zinc ribbon-containing protein [Verrucomicrobiae bacterium]|nr:TFIIB-type zinc ribbon-containing protein [Verrucomicrobiae bacterium]